MKRLERYGVPVAIALQAKNRVSLGNIHHVTISYSALKRCVIVSLSMKAFRSRQ